MATLFNLFFKAIGIGFLALAKAKSLSIGYQRARPFSSSEVDRCVDYDLKVVDEWLVALEAYSGGSSAQIRGARVLELGPGADFGVGLYFLAKGASEYAALDAFPLAYGAPAALHEALIKRISGEATAPGIDELRAAVPTLTKPGGNGRIRYVVRSDFDVAAAFTGEYFDYVFSQAAFEHFDDVESTIAQLSRVTRPGAKLVAGIDLQTHTRWIREKDPLNIYRYGKGIYRFFRFKGMPNRVPTSEYFRILRAYGWSQIELHGLWAVDEEYFQKVRNSLSPEYRKDQTRNLWIVVCATRVE